MGCDIHLVLEKRFDEKWVAINTFCSFHRATYGSKEPMDGFSSPVVCAAVTTNALAGVRGDGPAPLGLPEDASETTHALSKSWDSDGHSCSWLPLADAVKIWRETERFDLSDWAKGCPEGFISTSIVPLGQTTTSRTTASCSGSTTEYMP